MALWKSLSGYLNIEFTSADPEKTLAAITLLNISITNVVRRQELIYQIKIPRSDYKKLSDMFQKQNIDLKIVERQGLYWFLKESIYRPVILTTFLLIFTLSIFIPTRIFFVTVKGNNTIPEQKILSAAEECGICFAASRRLVRSEKVKNELLAAVPQLQWAGVNTAGCVAVISVQERTEIDEMSQNFVSNLVADQDGYILSTTIISGTPYIFPGKSVTKGQLLISGYTDYGHCIRMSRAIGEIYAQTSRNLAVVMPDYYNSPVATGKSNYKFSLIIGKKRINLWKDSRISGTGCGRMYEEYYISLPGGFRLPIAICIDQYIHYALQETVVKESYAMLQLQQYSEDYLIQQMVAGQIVQRQHHLTYADGLYHLKNQFTCTEMIGKERREQIGVMNGKRYGKNCQCGAGGRPDRCIRLF